MICATILTLNTFRFYVKVAQQVNQFHSLSNWLHNSECCAKWLLVWRDSVVLLSVGSFSAGVKLSSSFFLHSCCSLWSIGHMWNGLFHCSSLILRQSVGLFGQGISPSQGRYLHRRTRTQNKGKHPCLEWDSKPWSQCLSRRKHFMP
jgi:hypothetical protein